MFESSSALSVSARVSSPTTPSVIFRNASPTSISPFDLRVGPIRQHWEARRFPRALRRTIRESTRWPRRPCVDAHVWMPWPSLRSCGRNLRCSCVPLIGGFLRAQDFRSSGSTMNVVPLTRCTVGVSGLSVWCPNEPSDSPSTRLVSLWRPNEPSDSTSGAPGILTVLATCFLLFGFESSCMSRSRHVRGPFCNPRIPCFWRDKNLARC
jgi:hypothetical protein